MNTQETIIQLKDLNLRGIASSLEAIMNTPVQNRPSLNVAVAKLVDAELQDRRERKISKNPGIFRDYSDDFHHFNKDIKKFSEELLYIFHKVARTNP